MTTAEPRIRVAIVNTKGGAGKTTTAFYLAAGLADHGRTLLVDCDPQQSALSWSQAAELPFGVIGLPVPDVHKRGDLFAGYEHVVFDTPPGQVAIIRSAVLSAQIVLVPVAPTGVEVDRLRPTFELLAEIEPSHPIGVGVLLTKLRYGTTSAREVRAILADEYGYPVLATEIPMAETYAQSFGTTPEYMHTQFEALVKELMG